jgi:TolB-like protein/Tfp pilus assembly protein PilF
MGNLGRDVFSFEGYTLDLTRGCVRNADLEVELRPKSFELLSYLVTNAGRLISKDELVNAVWPNVIVSDDSLAQCVSDVRHVLNDPDRRIIKTVPRRGYLFAAPVSVRPLGSPVDQSLQLAATSKQGISQPRLAIPNLGIPPLSIVVLPFTNLSNDPDQQYFADGITDDLTTDLSGISGSFVIARNTAFTYKGKAVDAKQIGRDLGVRYIVEGSVRRGGDQILVNVQLVDAESSAHVWADRFETDRRNLAEAQSEITGRLARTLNVELVRDSGRRIELERADDPDASDLVMRGWAWYYRPFSAATYKEARRDFERALEIDPRSVDARIGLATSLLGNISGGWSSSEQQDQARAEQLLLEALERDTNRSMAHVAMGILRRLQLRLGESKMEFETAIALDRNNARAIFQLGQTMMWLGQPEAGIPLLEKAIRLNPHDPTLASHYAMLGLCHLVLGHVDQAIDLTGKARAENPRTYYIHLYLAGALGLRGDLEEAKAALAEAIRIRPEINSFARYRAYSPWITNPQHWALRENTLNVGLRRIGFPEE